MYYYYYRFVCVESEPLRLGVEVWLCFEINCYSCGIICVIVVEKIMTEISSVLGWNEVKASAGISKKQGKLYWIFGSKFWYVVKLSRKQIRLKNPFLV